MLDPSSFSPPYDDHLCRALAEAGAEVELFTRPLRQNEHYSAAGYTVHEYFYRVSEWASRLRWLKPVSRYLKALEHGLNLFFLARRLQRTRPDIIHFQWCPLPLLDVLFLDRLRKIAPLVLTVHNTKPFHGNPTSSLQGVGWKKILRTFDQLIVHTQQSRDQLVKAGCDSTKIVVIPHGALLPFEPPLTGKAPGLPDEPVPGRKTILFFGNVKPYKGVDLLLRAYARIANDPRKSAKVVIAGRSSIPREELERLIGELGIRKDVELDLRFLSDAELMALLGKASMFVFPYRDIDASGALMLALPYGKPVVASRLGIFREMLVDGESALLVDVDDVDGLAAAMERILSDSALARQLGEGARTVIDQYPSWDQIAHLSQDLYRRMMEHRVSRN